MSEDYWNPSVPGLSSPEGALFYDSLAELVANVRTGDLILLSGSGDFSGIVRMFARSPYSHVMVARVWVDPVTHAREVYCFESTQSYDPLDHYWASHLPEQNTRRWELLRSLGLRTPDEPEPPVPSDRGVPRFKTGPKLTRLIDKLFYYTGAFVTVRHLQISERRPLQRDVLARMLKMRLDACFSQVCNHPYESDIVKLAGAVIGGPLSHTWAGSGGGMFCTELAIYMLHCARVCKSLPKRPPPSYLLNDFCTGSDSLLCTPPFSYGPEISVRLPQVQEERQF